ncbi:MAG: triose-phosphate isomerase, partial [Defluviitaleaceae bacterium]|nr:triose-phosphate isomerase [Defluviitaleaceae bacterium]
MRKKIVAGNWKMNILPNEAENFAKDLANMLQKPENTEIIFCVPFLNIFPVKAALEGTGIKLGAQNLHFQDSGAYTGEISGKMLIDAGIEYVLCGHSERRQYFGETDEVVNTKAKKALEVGLIPIICIGETLTQRQLGITVDLLRIQVKTAMQGIPAQAAANVIIAYEPVWAIGTGVVASTEQAEEACAAIRQVLSEIYDNNVAEAIVIQYGGSVTAANSKELFAQPNIDGGLV